MSEHVCRPAASSVGLLLEAAGSVRRALTNSQVQHAPRSHDGEEAVDVVKDVLEHLVLGGGSGLQQDACYSSSSDRSAVSKAQKSRILQS